VEKRPATRELINWIRALKPIRTLSPSGWPRATCPFWACCSKKAAITSGPVPLSTGERCSEPCLSTFFYKLKEMGVPVSPTAFLTLHRALANRV
jgi:hypothetical protein